MQRKRSPIIMNKIFQGVSEKQLKKKKKTKQNKKTTKKYPNTKQKGPKLSQFKKYAFCSAVARTPHERCLCRILCFQPLAVPDHSVFVSLPFLLVFSLRANMKVISGLSPFVRVIVLFYISNAFFSSFLHKFLDWKQRLWKFVIAIILMIKSLCKTA